MTTLAQRSFAGGEIAPSLYGRVDIVKYATGLRTCRNFVVARHGGVFNRLGTVFVEEVKHSQKKTILAPFIFNPAQTYVLEFGHLYMRVIKNGAIVRVSNVPDWNSSTNYVAGDLVKRLDINYYCILSHINQQPPNPTYWYPLTGDIYEIPTPYDENDLELLYFNQSADVIQITHKNYEVRKLSRTADTTWKLEIDTFAPGISPPSGVSNNGSAGTATKWVVTSVADVTFEESVASAETSSGSTPSGGSPITVSWNAVSGAREYNVYKAKNGVFGFIGVAKGTSFIDNGIDPDTTDTPPETRNPFSGADNRPAISAYYQQRLGFANTKNNQELVEFSRTGFFKNFTISFPIKDDNAVRFQLTGRQVNAIQHMLDLGKLVILTDGAEWVIEGDAAGILKPNAINARQQSYYGSSPLKPLILGGTALFVQARGSIIRDLNFDVTTEKYAGNDLTIFASHLFDAYTIKSWAYQQAVHSIVWVVRDDGMLLGLTYVKEHQIWAWHKHDFENGFVESVCVVPEGNDDVLYLVIRRTINSAVKRYIERMSTFHINKFKDDAEDIKKAIFVDSCVSFDGTNKNESHTMTLSGGTNWTHDEILTLTSSQSFFSSGDVGNEIHLKGEKLIRCRIVEFINSTSVSVKPHKTVPVSMRSTAISQWGKAIFLLTGLSHLEGQNVSVFADGFVAASPKNPSYTVKTVSSGSVAIDRPSVIIHVGLPITSDLETLDIDLPNVETFADKKKCIGQVNIFVEKSRGLWAGPRPPSDENPVENLVEFKMRKDEDYDLPIQLKTGVIHVKIMPEWNSNGRVFIRQIDPVPVSILAVLPSGFIPIRS